MEGNRDPWAQLDDVVRAELLGDAKRIADLASMGELTKSEAHELAELLGRSAIEGERAFASEHAQGLRVRARELGISLPPPGIR